MGGVEEGALGDLRTMAGALERKVLDWELELVLLLQAI